MQNALNKIANNDTGRVILFVLFFVVGLKIIAPNFGELSKYIWIGFAGIAAAYGLKQDNDDAWPIALFIVIAMIPMGFIEPSKGLVVLIAVTVISIFVVRAMTKAHITFGYGAALGLGFGLALITQKIIENMPDSVGGLWDNLGF